ncbi:2838_t:CDS:1, partial [Entrophospora sp. SA101]
CGDINAADDPNPGMVSANPNFDPQLILKDFYDNLAPIVNFNPALTASYQGKGLTGQQAAAAYGSQPSLPDPERIDAGKINNLGIANIDGQDYDLKTLDGLTNARAAQRRLKN